MEEGTSFVYDSSLMPATLSVNKRYGTLDSSHFVGGTSGAKDGEQEGKKSRKEEGLRIEGIRVKVRS